MLPDMSPEHVPLLSVENVIVGYGQKQIIHGVNFKVISGEIVALIGHNGAGKSTLLKAIFGLLPIQDGKILLNGACTLRLTPKKMLQKGVAYVPQGNNVYPDLTVAENLQVGGTSFEDKDRLKQEIEKIFDLFPALKHRLNQRAGTLSGGEKQMLALANAMILSPRLLLLDGPSLGLSHPLVIETLEGIERISREGGVAVLVIEQKVREVLKIAQRVYVLRSGSISFTGMAEELHDDQRLRDVYL